MMKLRRLISAETYDNKATAGLARIGLHDDLIMSIMGHNSHCIVLLYAGVERQKLRARAANIEREKTSNK
jgi:hypothetical protein